MPNCNVAQAMTERRSPRLFDDKYEIPQKDLETILDAIRNSPSAYGILNTRVLVIPRGKVTEELLPIFFNQPNFKSASVNVLFIADKWEKISRKTIPETVQLMFPKPEHAEIRKNFTQNIKNRYPSFYEPGNTKGDDWSIEQAYIALGVGILAASVVGVDNGPMTGFYEDQLTDYLRKNKYIGEDEFPVANLALGKAITEGILQKPKTHLPLAEFAKVIK